MPTTPLKNNKIYYLNKILLIGSRDTFFKLEIFHLFVYIQLLISTTVPGQHGQRKILSSYIHWKQPAGRSGILLIKKKNDLIVQRLAAMKLMELILAALKLMENLIDFVQLSLVHTRKWKVANVR